MTELKKEAWEYFNYKAKLKDKRVLLVDDQAAMRKAIRFSLKGIGLLYLLKDTGRGLEEAKNGEEALAAINKREYHLVICDWDMPKAPGIKVLQAIRNHRDEKIQSIPFMMVTAVTQRDQILWALEEGSDGYIVKPLSPGIIEDGIKQTLWKAENLAQNRNIIREAKKLIASKQYSEALKLCRQAIEEGSRSPSIRFWTGKACESQGGEKEEEAFKWYYDAIEQNSMFNLSRYALSNLYLKQGNIDQALELSKEAAKLSPGNPAWQKQMGEILLKKEDKEEAEKAFQQAARQDPDIAKEIGEKYLDQKDYKHATLFFREAMSKFSSIKRHDLSLNERREYLHIFNRLGISLREDGKCGEAIKEYNKALLIDPENPALHFNKGKAYSKWGGCEEKAQECFEKADELNNSRNQPDPIICQEVEKELNRLRS